MLTELIENTAKRFLISTINFTWLLALLPKSLAVYCNNVNSTIVMQVTFYFFSFCRFLPAANIIALIRSEKSYLCSYYRNTNLACNIEYDFFGRRDYNYYGDI